MKKRIVLLGATVFFAVSLAGFAYAKNQTAQHGSDEINKTSRTVNTADAAMFQKAVLEVAKIAEADAAEEALAAADIARLEAAAKAEEAAKAAAVAKAAEEARAAEAAKAAEAAAKSTSKSSGTSSSGSQTSQPAQGPVFGGNSEYMAQAEQLVNSQYGLVMQHINGVNQYRAQVGLAPLVYDRTLSLIAAYRSIEMAAANKLSHYGSDGSVRMQVVSDYFGITPNMLGENIASGASSTAFANAYSKDEQTNINHFISTQSVQNFGVSPQHYQNIINGGFTKIGVACGFANDQYGHLYVTEIFSN